MVSDSYERIDRLLNLAEDRIARVFRAAVRALRESLDLNALADLLESGDWEGALNMLSTLAEQLGTESSVVFVMAGQDTARFLSAADIGHVAFDQVNHVAVDIMRASQLALITNFTNSQRAAVREVLTDGIARGINPVEQARLFRDAIGLTDRQARAVLNYRRLLEQAGRSDVSVRQQAESLTRALRDARGDRAVRSAIRRGRPLPKEQVDRMVQRYYERSVKYRSEVIARTEALRSVHQGTEQAFTQAIQEGRIRAEDVIQRWNSARDSRVRDSHAMLNGQEQPLGGVWIGLHGALRYPGDPLAPPSETVQCRCVVTRTIRRPE